MSSVERVNAINVGLILASAAVAWVLPFELFLLSYAVLGPLHYLTEISWLHDRAYFTTSPWDAVALAALGAAAFLSGFLRLLPWDGWVVLALGVAASGVIARSAGRKWAVAAAALCLCLVLQRWQAGWIFLVALLPTVIHVFCFTGLFLLHGCLKSRGPWGYASLAVFLACGMVLLLYRPASSSYGVSARTAALATEFAPVIDQLGKISGDPSAWDNLAAIGRFLGFAYTYHYLNWFSKTGVIRWHRVTRRRTTVIAVVYAASLALYAYDYRVGLIALAALSLVHVLLEFPLDLRTAAALTGRR